MKKENLMPLNLQLFASEDEEGNDANNTSDGGENANNGADNGEDKQDEKPEKTFTQSQVNTMMTKEKKQGRNSVLKELGIDPADSKALESLKNLIASQKTDEELKAQKDKENLEAMAELQKRAEIAEAKSEAMMAGIKPQYVDDAVTLAFSKMGEDGELKTVLAEFKTKYPMWFNVSDDENNTGQKGTGSTLKGGDKSTAQTKSLGARLAAQKTGNNTNSKKSYWGDN